MKAPFLREAKKQKKSSKIDGLGERMANKYQKEVKEIYKYGDLACNI